MPRDPLIYLQDALREVAYLESLAHRTAYDPFATDPDKLRASAFAVQCLSEAVRQLPDDWLAEHPNIPWREIKGISNKIRHEYFRLEPDILWSIASRDIEPLKAALSKMLVDKSPLPS